MTGEELRNTGFYTPAFAKLVHECMRAGQKKLESIKAAAKDRDEDDNPKRAPSPRSGTAFPSPAKESCQGREGGKAPTYHTFTGPQRSRSNQQTPPRRSLSKSSQFIRRMRHPQNVIALVHSELSRRI